MVIFNKDRIKFLQQCMQISRYVEDHIWQWNCMFYYVHVNMLRCRLAVPAQLKSVSFSFSHDLCSCFYSAKKRRSQVKKALYFVRVGRETFMERSFTYFAKKLFLQLEFVIFQSERNNISVCTLLNYIIRILPRK